MAEKRSTRVKKQIDYSKFSGVDSENDFAEDDDFENFTPPVTKKSKIEKKMKKENKTTLKSAVTVHPEPAPKRPNPRKSLDDKVFEKELELALELSKSDNSQVEKVKQDNPDEDNGIHNTDTSEVQKQVSVISSVQSSDQKLPAAVIKECDTIEVLQENIEDIPQKRSVSKKRVYVEDDCSTDDDFKLDGDREDSESDFNPSDDDMEFKPTKKQSKKTEKKSKKPVTETKSSKKNTVEPKAACKSVPRSNQVASCPAGQSAKKPRLSPATSIVPRTVQATSIGMNRSGSKSPLAAKPLNITYKSPSPAVHSQSPGLGGVNLKSPNYGGLRLGLSRNARLKPLHANVKITPSAR